MATPKIKNVLVRREDWAPNTAYASWNKLSVKQKQKGVSKPKNKYETVDHYEYYWYYKIRGQSRMFRDNGWTSVGASILTSTFSIPDNAVEVGFHIKPVSKKYKKDKKTKSYWTGAESSAKLNLGHVSQTPSAPTVTLEETKFTAKLTNLPAGINRVHFEVVEDDYYGKAPFAQNNNVGVSTQAAKYEITVRAGHRYKARCRITGTGYSWSGWSDWSENTEAIPEAVKKFTEIKSTSSSSISLKWEKSKLADSYEIEYVNKLEDFDRTSAQNATATINQILLSLESGKTYYFRIRAVKGSYKSAWYPTDPWDLKTAQYITIGKVPTAPTTYSLVSSIPVNEKIRLYWLHNAQDNSAQRRAEIELKFIGTPIGTITERRVIENTNYGNVDTEDENLFYEIDTSKTHTGVEWDEEQDDYGSAFTIDFSDGLSIEWRVRTMGVIEEYGPWSVVRKVDIWGKPFINMIASTTLSGWVWDPFRFATDTIYTAAQAPIYQEDNVFTTLPIGISIESGPVNQTPIGYYFEIIAVNEHDYVDHYGERVVIAKDQVIYSNYLSTERHSFIRMINASDVNLIDGQTYILRASVTMNSGLSATTSDYEFTVDWEDLEMYADASISIEPDYLYASITPYCKDQYGDDDIDVEGEPVEDEEEDDEDFVEPQLIENVVLFVYRMDVNGEFVEIARNVSNDYTTITDPHPTLGYVKYRIVAVKIDTGQIVFHDCVPVEVEQTGIVITWDEQTYDIQDDEAYDPDVVIDETEYSGSMLVLPFNVDISESYSPDVSLVDYIGRKRSVSYYGTHLGETSTWKSDVQKSDEETLMLLRRLSAYTGDVYVRESQGRTGYWANVRVSFDINHTALIVPVNLSITRVEGGA